MIRTGELKARIITDENNEPYFYVLLIKENKDILKPKRGDRI